LAWTTTRATFGNCCGRSTGVRNGRWGKPASATTLGIGKKAFYEQIELAQAEAYERTARIMCSNALEEDAQEGMRAFLEKRKPVWKESRRNS
jgi:enoyl-CoA hydratase/carnithine racemase